MRPPHLLRAVIPERIEAALDDYVAAHHVIKKVKSAQY
jgi:hypothetical protein